MISILLFTGETPGGKNLINHLAEPGTYNLVPVYSVPAALESRNREQIDVVVALFSEEFREGFDLLRALRDKGDRIPFILFLEVENPAVAFDALMLDAGHYVRTGSPAQCRTGLSKIIGKYVECQRLKKTVAEQEKTFNTLFHQSPIGKEIFDAGGMLVDVNEACLKIFGVTGKHQLESYRLLDDPNLTETQRLQLAAHETIRAEIEFDFEKVKAHNLYPTSKSGTIFLDVLITPVCENGSQQCSGYLVHIQDISGQKRSQEALAMLNKKLSLVGSVTRHDVLNQLTAIVGYNELLGMMVQDPKLKSFLEKERQAIEKIQRQFKFAKEYQNIGVGSPEWQNIRDVVSRMGDELELANVQVTVTTGNGSIYADPLFERVIYNLFDNALRHGEKVSEIRVSLHETDTGAVLIIEDNGVGIAAEEKTRIFERGYGKNTGWGLFLIEEILAITGLSIVENGVPGKGARFEINIPPGKYRM